MLVGTILTISMEDVLSVNDSAIPPHALVIYLLKVSF